MVHHRFMVTCKYQSLCSDQTVCVCEKCHAWTNHLDTVIWSFVPPESKRKTFFSILKLIEMSLKCTANEHFKVTERSQIPQFSNVLLKKYQLRSNAAIKIFLSNREDFLERNYIVGSSSFLLSCFKLFPFCLTFSKTSFYAYFKLLFSLGIYLWMSVLCLCHIKVL